MAWRQRHIPVAAVVGALAGVGSGSAVYADPAGPTDYRSTVVSIDPPTAQIEARILGGDSFFELEVRLGSVVEVIGYEGEPYLRFLADGTVEENRNSPTRYLNVDRFGAGDVPDSAFADAAPEWRRVGDGGRYAWHDHRTHWMQTSRPLGAARGDQILESVVPLVVDGVAVDVTVRSVWAPAPSWLPAWLGLACGVLLAALTGRWWWHNRRSTPVALVAVGVAFAALSVGVWQFVSLPSETGPRWTWWLLPFLAVVLVGVEWFLSKRDAVTAAALVALIGLLLSLWGWQRRDGLRRAILPTDAPFWLDRFVTALALSGGAVAFVTAVAAMFSSSRRRSPR
jgi:hypothetical protein